MAVRTSSPYTFSVADTGLITGSGFAMETRDQGSGVFQLTGTFTATVVFEATDDGTNWFDIYGTPVTAAADAASATASGQWRFNLGGIVKMRFRCSSYASGTPIGTFGVTSGVLGNAGSSTPVVSGSVNVITSMVPGGGATHLGKAEDAAHTSGDTGVFVLAVQKATPADLATDGDYAALEVSGGYLYTHPKTTLNEDVAVGAAQPLTMVGAMRSHSPAATSGTDLDAEPLQIENGLLWTGNKTLATSYGVTSAVFSSADATSAAAVTDAPTSGQKIVIDDILVSSITATNFDFECETSAVKVLQFFTTTTAPGVVFMKGLGIKLATADKKLMIKAANAGQVYCTVTYHSEA